MIADPWFQRACNPLKARWLCGNLELNVDRQSPSRVSILFGRDIEAHGLVGRTLRRLVRQIGSDLLCVVGVCASGDLEAVRSECCCSCLGSGLILRLEIRHPRPCTSYSRHFPCLGAACWR